MKHKAFTFIEFLITTVIIALCAVLVLEVVHRVGKRAKKPVQGAVLPSVPRFNIEHINSGVYLVTDTWTHWQYLESHNGGWQKLDQSTNQVVVKVEADK
jgi:prepilin-type N-terminal cleavage/methylation domain-containing protein